MALSKNKKSGTKPPAFEGPDNDSEGVHDAERASAAAVLAAAKDYASQLQVDALTPSSPTPPVTQGAVGTPTSSAPAVAGLGVGDDRLSVSTEDIQKDPFGIGKSTLPVKVNVNTGAIRELSEMPLHELLAIRAEIDTLLPPCDLASINLEAELVLQFHAAKDLQARVLNKDNHAQANYAAAVMNASTAVLKQVVDMQTSLFDAERVKAIEFALERAFMGAPTEVKEAFVERYRTALAEARGPKTKREKVA